MTTSERVGLFGVVVVVAFDAIASVVSRSSGIPYEWATYGSWILYTVLGYVAGRASPATALKSAALAGVIIGLGDATLGWATSWILGPGRVAGGVSAVQWSFVAVIVTFFAIGFGALGGSIFRMQNSRKH